MSRRKDRLARIKWANEQMALRTQMRDKIATLTQERDDALWKAAFLKDELARREVPTVKANGREQIVDIATPPRDRLMRLVCAEVTCERLFGPMDPIGVRERISTIEFQEMRTALRNGMQIRWWMPVSRD
jgi:hypothetical protein